MTNKNDKKYIDMIENRPSFLEENKEVVDKIIKTYQGEVELKPYIGESNEDFENRREITAGTNVFAQDVKILVSKINQSEIIFGDGYDLIKTFNKDNVDGLGTSLEHYMINLTTDLISQGLIGVVPYLNNKGKIFLKHHTYKDFIGYFLTDDYSEIEAVGFEDTKELFIDGRYQEKKIYKFYTSEGVRVFIKTDRGIVEKGSVAYKSKGLPISIMTCGIKRKLFDIIPEFKKEAYLNIKINRLESIVADLIYKQNQSIIVVYSKTPINGVDDKKVTNIDCQPIQEDYAVSETAKKSLKHIQIGDLYRFNDKREEGVEIVDFETKSMKMILDEIANLKNTIHNGMYNRSSRTDLVKNKTRKEAEGENQEQKSFFTNIINGLERMLNEVIKYGIAENMCNKKVDRVGKDGSKVGDYDIQIKNNNNRSILFEYELKSLVELAKEGKLSTRAILNVLKLNDVLDKDFDIDDEMNEIERENKMESDSVLGYREKEKAQPFDEDIENNVKLDKLDK